MRLEAERLARIEQSIVRPIIDPSHAPTAAVAPPPQQQRKGPPKLPELVTTDGQTVYRAEFEDGICLIDKLLFAGVTIFAGRPKVGKSFAALQLAVSVATGAPFMDHFPVRKMGRVLYFALEEPQQRTTKRIRRVVDDQVYLQNINFVYGVRPLLNGGKDQIEAYLEANPTELVIIDTLLAFVRASLKRDVMRSDYEEIDALRLIAQKHKTAIVLIHHLRKSSAEYGLDAVAGTTGVTAAADAVWTLRKLPTGDCILEIVGREMEEQSYGMKLEATESKIGWRFIGEGSDVALSEERRDILELLKENGPLKSREIAARLRKNESTVRRLISMLMVDNFITRNPSGGYVLAQNVL